MNNDFGVTRDAICQWFSLVTSSLETNGRLANLELTSLVNEATGHQQPWY